MVGFWSPRPAPAPTAEKPLLLPRGFLAWNHKPGQLQGARLLGAQTEGQKGVSLSPLPAQEAQKQQQSCSLPVFLSPAPGPNQGGDRTLVPL